MKYKEEKINSISELLIHLKNHSGNYQGPLWFRGQPNIEYKLLPSYYRYKNPPSEMTLMQKFRQNASMLLKYSVKDDFEWLFIMQHHTVPTRLLDWSESSLVGCYFTCCENLNHDGALWVLLPCELNKHAGIDPDEIFKIPSVHDLQNERFLSNYSPQSYHADRTSQMPPIAAITFRNTARMQAQLGTFTIFHKSKTPIEAIGDKKHIWRYIIPKEKKGEILKELQLLGVTKFQLFPELQSIGEIIKNAI